MKIRHGFVSNSSSSSFVCDTKMSIKEITVDLKEMLSFYNRLFKQNHKFEEVFRQPFKATSDYSEDMKINWEYNCPVGSIVIESAEDNSIPYELFDLIERKFDAHRNHLG